MAAVNYTEPAKRFLMRRALGLEGPALKYPIGFYDPCGL
jgi:hypothetical protein